MDSVLDLRRRGLTANNLARLSIRMSKKGQVNVGWPYRPSEVITAQMNGYYIGAVTLLDGDAFIDQFTKRGSPIRNPRTLAEDRHRADPELDLAGALSATPCTSTPRSMMDARYPPLLSNGVEVRSILFRQLMSSRNSGFSLNVVFGIGFRRNHENRSADRAGARCQTADVVACSRHCTEILGLRAGRVALPASCR